jgi:endonuclease/exonuclease/phosphatase (EEP) superfamily protein YafD
MSHRRSWLARLGWTYVLLIGLWLLLRWLFFDTLWWLALLNTIAEYLFVPLPLLLALGLWRRSWRMLLGLCLPLVAFSTLFGALLLPKRPDRTAAQAPAITAMTFNILTGNKDAPAIIGAIQAAQPDIVGFQEITRARKVAISGALAGEYPHHTLLPVERFSGVGLISRFPIEHAERVSLPPRDYALHAILRVGEARVHVFVVHLSANGFGSTPAGQYVALVKERYAQRQAEVARLKEEFDALHEPALLLCDCNMTDSSQAYTQLAAFLSDSFREAGWGLGHSSFGARPPHLPQRLDYIWHSAEFIAVDAVVGPDGGSDHLPVVARLVLLDDD